MRRALALEARAAVALGVEQVSPVEVVGFLVSLRPTIAKSSWRQMKASLLHRYGRVATPAAKQAIGALMSETSAEALKRGTTTSSLRRRRISDGELADCLSAIRATPSSYKEILESWLVLGLLTGLRPHEWRHAEVIEMHPSAAGAFYIGHQVTIDDDPRPFLMVGNSKATNGRANGLVRHIDLTALPRDTVMALAAFASLMRRIDAEPGGYRRVYMSCCKLLRRVQPANRGKLLQLYSPRHQFTSSAKKVMTLPELAATLGHATDATARRHYGKRRHGSPSGVGVRPTVNETSTVRRVATVSPSRRGPDTASGSGAGKR